jgi:spore coat polysaccharide biosynthesis protein SpsF
MFRAFIKKYLLGDLLVLSQRNRIPEFQKSPEFLEWIQECYLRNLDAFFQQKAWEKQVFINGMNRTFQTERFSLFSKRWLVDYGLNVLELFDDSIKAKIVVILNNDSFHQALFQVYSDKFGVTPQVKWQRKPSLTKTILFLCSDFLIILFLGFNNGLTVKRAKVGFKVLKEAVFGFKKHSLFRDDYFVDNHELKVNEILYFTRSNNVDPGRIKAAREANEAGVEHVYLHKLRFPVQNLFSLFFRKYTMGSLFVLYASRSSEFFPIFQNMYIYFLQFAVPYEKLYGQYAFKAEMGHNYFSANHIVEAIVAENYGTRYYLTHWSDKSARLNYYIMSYLASDKFCVWGKAHVRNVEGDESIYALIGYPFKEFILKARNARMELLAQMRLEKKWRIVSFFDESFGGSCKMTEIHYLHFWEMILQVAERFPDWRCVIKPKVFSRYNNLSEPLRKRFLHIVERLRGMANVHFLDEEVWTFVEVIGVSDVVVSQGMTSSSTIALICGINGLYLDEAQCQHPFRDLYKNKLVFDEQEALVSQLERIVNDEENPLREIPQILMRKFDAYEDDKGADRLRQILLYGKITETKRLPKKGIIIQARMGSTLLPGKVMKKIQGESLLAILLQRLKRVGNIDVIIVATTDQSRDDAIVDCARQHAVECFRGDENHVLKRYYEAAKQFGLDVIIRITSDCPLADPNLIEDMLNAFLIEPEISYMSNALHRTFPRGFDAEVFSFSALERAFHNAKEAYQREHVTPYIMENEVTKNYTNNVDYSQFRVTVDTPEDFLLVTKIFEHLGGVHAGFVHSDVTKLLLKNSDLVEINKYIEQNELKA